MPTGNHITFGEYIRKLREEHALPLRKIAAKLDMDPSTLGKIERNERNANYDLIKKLAGVFKIDEKEMLSVYVSDKVAFSIYEANLDKEVLRVAEDKVEYLKRNGNAKR